MEPFKLLTNRIQTFQDQHTRKRFEQPKIMVFGSPGSGKSYFIEQVFDIAGLSGLHHRYCIQVNLRNESFCVHRQSQPDQLEITKPDNYDLTLLEVFSTENCWKLM